MRHIAAMVRRIMRSGHHRIGWMFMCLAMLIAATMVSVGMLEHVGPGGGHPAVDAVRGYLTAVKERDIAAALDYTADHAAHDDRLLTAEAIDPDWDVENLQLATTEYRNTVVIATLVASDGRTASGVFTLSPHADTWQIIDPFVTVYFQNPSVGAVAANDEQVTVDPDEPQVFSLFPGLYRLQSFASDLVESDGAQHLAVNGEVVTGDSPSVALSEVGERELQAQVDLLLDDCVSKQQLTLQGCPFGVANSVRGESGTRFYELDDLTWTVQRYPVVTGVQVEDGFTVADRDPGIVELTGTGVRRNGDTEDVNLTCSVDTSKLAFEIVDDRLRLFEYQIGGADEADATGNRTWWATCPS